VSVSPTKVARLAVAALAVVSVFAGPGAAAAVLPPKTVPREALQVTNVDPPTPPAGKQVELIIYGQGFSEEEADVEVRVGGILASEVRVVSPKRLKAVIPAKTQVGPSSVSVKNPNGDEATLSNAVYFRRPEGGFSLGATWFKMRHDWRGFVEWFKLGGPLMYVLAAISFFGVAWAIHCMLVLRRSQIVPRRFMESLSSCLSQGDVKGATTSCERTRCVFGRVILSGLRKVGEPPEKLREAVGAAGARESAHLHQKIRYLANVGTISPMLGLLGTVFGMIMAFNIISSGDVRHYLLAAAIAQAMVTTAAGLVIGIPAMAVYFYLRGRLLRLTTHMEAVADEVAQSIIEKGEEA